jgi:hypothetical protein
MYKTQHGYGFEYPVCGRMPERNLHNNHRSRPSKRDGAVRV